jgi:hypothetical protein
VVENAIDNYLVSAAAAAAAATEACPHFNHAIEDIS